MAMPPATIPIVTSVLMALAPFLIGFEQVIPARQWASLMLPASDSPAPLRATGGRETRVLPEHTSDPQIGSSASPVKTPDNSSDTCAGICPNQSTVPSNTHWGGQDPVGS